MATLRGNLFEKFFLPGSVWGTRETFENGTSAYKYLVIIRDLGSGVFYLRATSQSRYFKVARHCAFVKIPKGTYGFFSLETYINCDQLFSRKRTDFSELHERIRIDYTGQLDAEFLAAIEEKIKASRVLSRSEKDYLFGKY